MYAELRKVIEEICREAEAGDGAEALSSIAERLRPFLDNEPVAWSYGHAEEADDDGQ